jgi:cobalt transporter subunit CbtB
MQTAHSAATPLATGKTATVLAAALLGAFFVYVVGFLPAQAMHDAAHDTRHAITAPCH